MRKFSGPWKQVWMHSVSLFKEEHVSNSLSIGEVQKEGCPREKRALRYAHDAPAHDPVSGYMVCVVGLLQTTCQLRQDAERRGYAAFRRREPADPRRVGGREARHARRPRPAGQADIVVVS